MNTEQTSKNIFKYKIAMNKFERLNIETVSM